MKKMVLFTLAAVMAFGVFAGCQSEKKHVTYNTRNIAQNTMDVDK